MLHLISSGSLDSDICHVNDLQNSFYGVALGSTVMSSLTILPHITLE